MSTQLELPVEARLLIPLLTAWREAPAELDKNTRAKLVGDRMRKLEASFKDEDVLSAVESLEMRLGDICRAMEPAPRVLAPGDTECAVCGHPVLQTQQTKCIRVNDVSEVYEAEVYSKTCLRCHAIHSVNSVSSHPAVLVLEVPCLVPGPKPKMNENGRASCRKAEQLAAQLENILHVRQPVSILRTPRCHLASAPLNPLPRY